MLNIVNPISARVGDEMITIHSYVIDETLLVADVASSNRDSLKECFGSHYHGRLFIHSGAIDTAIKGDQFFQIVESLDREGSPSRRVVIAQLALFDEEDLLISNEHCEFLMKEVRYGLEGKIAHHPFPTEHLRYRNLRARLPELSLRQYHRVERLAACEAFCSYGLWVADELEKIKLNFKKESPELYALEGAIADFLHEARSPLIKAVREQIAELLLTMNGELLAIERHWVPLRQELAFSLAGLIEQLDTIGEAFNALAGEHPELLAYMHLPALYRELLAEWVYEGEVTAPIPWARSWFLLLFLWFETGAVITVNSLYGQTRSYLAFASALAAAQLWNQAPRHQLLDLFMNWNEAARALNCYEVQGRTPPYHDKRLHLADQLRRSCLAILRVAPPTQKENPPANADSWNEELLSLLPVVSKEEGKLLICDPVSGEVLGLTEKGRELLNS